MATEAVLQLSAAARPVSASASSATAITSTTIVTPTGSEAALPLPGATIGVEAVLQPSAAARPASARSEGCMLRSFTSFILVVQSFYLALLVFN